MPCRVVEECEDLLREMLWAVAGIWLVVMVPATVVIGMHMAERFL